MRIALVSQAYPPGTAHGGISTQTHAKAHGLAALGHSVHVIAHSADNSRHELWDGPVQVLRIPNIDNRLPICTEPVRWLTYSTEVAAAVAALHAQVHLDVIDFPEYGGEGYVYLLNQTEWNHVPTVIHLHGPLVMLAHTIGWPDLDSEFYRVATEMERTCLRLADGVLTSSRTSADWCARQYDLDVANAPVLHTGVDVSLFRPLEVPKAHRPTVIFVGKIVHNKGVDHLVDAACRVAADFPGLHVRLFGPGDDRLMARLREKTAACGHPDLLEFAGVVLQKELPQHLSRAHLFAAPSLYEGGPGFVYLEAMACGLPVIACSGSGVAEVVSPGENGLLVPPGDVDALAGALRHLLGDATARAEMGERARRYVLAEADSRVCLQRLESFYAGAAILRRGTEH
jgi:glycosyltransferase involved in cell wall biosynthesis